MWGRHRSLDSRPSPSSTSRSPCPMSPNWTAIAVRSKRSATSTCTTPTSVSIRSSAGRPGPSHGPSTCTSARPEPSGSTVTSASATGCAAMKAYGTSTRPSSGTSRSSTATTSRATSTTRTRSYGCTPVRVDLFTCLPQLLEPVLSESLLGKAREGGVVDVRVHDLREYTTDRHRSVDDTPFGGGPGIVLAPDPIFRAVESVSPARPLFLLGPGGRRFDQAMAAELASGAGFSLLCGRRGGGGERGVGP